MVLYSNLEKSFVIKALSGGLRLDGRKPHEFRDMDFVYDADQRGLVTVTMGSTRVVASITGSLLPPYPDRPAEGAVNYYVQLSSTTLFTAALDHEEDQTAELEATLQRFLDRILKNNRIVDTESLCVVPGELVWSIRGEVKVVAAQGGSLADAVVAATVAALLDFRRSDTLVGEDGKVKVFTLFEKHPIPLTLNNPPLAVSLSLIDLEMALSADPTTMKKGPLVVLADPLPIEESLGGLVTVALNRPGEMVTWVKRGGNAVDLDVLRDECMVLARARVLKLLDTINATSAKFRNK